MAALLGASGCVGGNAPAFTVGWDTRLLDGVPITCQQADTPSVELTMISLTNHRKYVNTFPCDARGGESEPLTGGRYDVTIALKNKAGITVSDQQGEFPLVRDGLTDLGILTFPIQSFHISWTLARGPMGLRCQDVDAKTVNIVTRLNSEDEVVYPFPCGQGRGDTPAILTGSYSVRLQLIKSTGEVLWDTKQPMTIEVNDKERAVLLPVVFDVQ